MPAHCPRRRARARTRPRLLLRGSPSHHATAAAHEDHHGQNRAPPDAGSVTIRTGQPGFPRTDLPRPQRQAMREELPTDPGSVTIGVNKQYPTPFRSSVKIVAQEPVPGERGSVFSTASHQYPTPLRTPPRIASGVELQPEGLRRLYPWSRPHQRTGRNADRGHAAGSATGARGATAHAGQPSSLPPFSQPPPGIHRPARAASDLPGVSLYHPWAGGFVAGHQASAGYRRPSRDANRGGPRLHSR